MRFIESPSEMLRPHSTVFPEVGFIDANDLVFEVFQAGPERSGKLALCLHGFPEHAHSWRFQWSLLARLGYRVWAPNLRGYGHSSRPGHVQDYAIEKLLKDVAGLIDASGADEVVLIAHDWGALIAWYFAMHQIRPLNRLVIMNVPHPGPFARELKCNWEQKRRSWYGLFFQFPVLPELLLGRHQGKEIGELFPRTANHPENFTEYDVRVFSESAKQPQALTAMINYYRAIGVGGGGRRMTAKGFPVLHTPTLMIWGEEDMALTKATTLGTEDYVADLTLKYLPGISHWVQQDAPEQVNRLLEDWLTS